MCADRVKISAEDDPLASMFGSAPRKPKAVVDLSQTTTTSEALSSIDTDKIVFKVKKEKVTQSSSSTERQQNPLGITSASTKAKYGFSSSLFESNSSSFLPSASPLKASDDVLLGANDGDADAEENIFKTQKSVSTIPTTTSGTGTLRVGSGISDDMLEKVDDLHVGKIMERETTTDEDFLMFGKSKAAEEVRAVKAKLEAAAPAPSADGLDEQDDLGALDTAAASLAKQREIKKAAAAQVPVAPVDVPEIDLASMDLDAYMASQSTSDEGGLFD